MLTATEFRKAFRRRAGRMQPLPAQISTSSGPLLVGNQPSGI